MTLTVPFRCPNRGALYQVVKVEAGPETVDCQISCRTCGARLVGREGSFILKYFLLLNPGQLRRASQRVQLRHRAVNTSEIKCPHDNRSRFAAILAIGLLSLVFTLPSEFWRPNRGAEKIHHTH